jgi:hypothetical protein
MCLLNASSLNLEEFFDDNLPRYAILSHRWQDGEVLLQNMQHGTEKSKGGYWKIKSCCEQAVEDELSHAWVDTSPLPVALYRFTFDDNALRKWRHTRYRNGLDALY